MPDVDHEFTCCGGISRGLPLGGASLQAGVGTQRNVIDNRRDVTQAGAVHRCNL